MRIFENILDQIEASDVSATDKLTKRSDARLPRTPEYFSLYIKICILKISMRDVNRPALDKAVDNLYDVLETMPFIDSYSDVILTNPAPKTNPLFQKNEEDIDAYTEDEVKTHDEYAYVCFAVNPDFKKFSELATFICRIMSVFKSFADRKPMIEYVFPSQSNPGVWKELSDVYAFSTETDEPLCLDYLSEFMKACQRKTRGSSSLLDIKSAAHYAVIAIGNLIAIDYRQKAYTDMYKYLGLYDLVEYVYHGTDIETVKNYTPNQLSFGFMNGVEIQMMNSEVDLKTVLDRRPLFLKFFLSDPYFPTTIVIIQSLLNNYDIEKFKDIIFYNRISKLKPRKIYFNIDSKSYPSIFRMDVYLGVVDSGIGEYKQLCLSYPFMLNEENSVEYFIDWVEKEIKELTGVKVEDSVKKQLIKTLEDNRLKK